MKTGIEGLVMSVDLQQYADAPLFVFFLIGFLITSLIQASSATMAITLSALFAGAVTLNDAIAIILGSEIGTTIKLFVASINGAASKRRVALGSFYLMPLLYYWFSCFFSPEQTGDRGDRDKG